MSPSVDTMSPSVDTISFKGYTAGTIQMENQICTQVYGGGVVCGAHTPVNAGIAENLLLIGIILLVSALVLAVFSKRLKATN